jgi:cytochrome P450
MRNPILVSLKMRMSQARALAAAAYLGGRLAPGDLHFDDSRIRNDQFHLLALSKANGPVFKVWHDGKITNCIVGFERCRRFLQANSNSLRADTVDFSKIIPHGFLRAMEGGTHQKYRQLFIAAMRGVSLDEQEAELKAILRHKLSSLESDCGAPEALIAQVLKRAATEIMLRLVYGVDANTEFGKILVAAHDKYVPDAMPVVIRESEVQHFAALRQLMDRRMAAISAGDGSEPSLLGNILEKGPPDQTVLGNLVQMVQFGRYDTHGLWRWVVHFMAGQPALMNAIAAESDLSQRRKLAHMAVCEVLRMSQAEAIVRIVTKPFLFENHAFTKRTRVRLCIWESHRNERNFAEPDEFHHQRFQSGMPGADRFAPLGMDHHLCLGANWTYVLGAMFIECLAEQYELRILKSAPTEMGRYHFEPGAGEVTEFRPRLTKTATVET